MSIYSTRQGDLTIDQEIEYPRCHDIISTTSHNFKAKSYLWYNHLSVGRLPINR